MLLFQPWRSSAVKRGSAAHGLPVPSGPCRSLAVCPRQVSQTLPVFFQNYAELTAEHQQFLATAYLPAARL